MFSRRTSWKSSANPLSLLLDSKKNDGIRVLNLTEFNPTQCGLEYPQELIATVWRGTAAPDYRPDPRGDLPARQALSAYYAEKGVTLSPQDIFLVSGTSEAYSVLLRLLCDPGDAVLIPRPGYPLLDYLADMDSVRLIPYDCEYLHPRGWHLDLDSVERGLAAGARAVITVHPNNPTGHALREKERNGLGELCARYGAALIADEVFLDYSLDGVLIPSLLGQSEALTFVLSGISKVLSLPHLKLSWICLSGLRDMVQAAELRMEIICDSFLSVNTPVQKALSEWLPHRLVFQSGVLQRCRANLGAIEEYFRGTAFRVLSCQAGWTAVIQVPSVQSEEEWSLGLLGEENLLCYPGHYFDMQDGAFLVCSLILPSEELMEGLSRIMAYYHRHSV